MVAATLHRVLVVDDDRDVMEQLERVLQRCGAGEIVHVRRLQAAGARLAAGERFDVIVVDVDMNTVAAGTVLDRIAGGGGEGNEAPILFIAEVKSRRDVVALQEAGCHSYLMKPLNDTILEKKIRDLTKKNVSQENEQAIVAAIRDCFSMGLLNEAESKLKPVLQRFPASSTYQVLLGELFFLRGDLKNAQAVLTKAQKLNPDSFDVQLLAERVIQKIEEAEKAREAAEEKARREAMYREAEKLNMQAMSFSKSGAFEEAISMYEEAIARSEGMQHRHVIFFNAAMSNFKAGKFDRAKELCQASYDCSGGSYEKARSFIDKISAEEKRQADAKAAAGSSLFGEMPGMDGLASQGGEAANPMLNPEEEARILKFIMFEGRY